MSYCATCDAAFFREQPTIIVGGGDSAMEEAIFLAKFSSEVVVVHRRAEFRASKIMLERAKETDNLTFLTPYTVDEFLPGENGALDVARLRNAETGEQKDLTIKGAFIAIGHEPQSQLVSDHLATDEEGYVVVEGRTSRTARPGVFAAGDLIDPSYRQPSPPPAPAARLRSTLSATCATRRRSPTQRPPNRRPCLRAPARARHSLSVAGAAERVAGWARRAPAVRRASAGCWRPS